MISEQLRAQIRRLFFAEHWRVGTIVAQLDVHPDTVRRAINLDRFVSRSETRPSALDPFIEFIRETFAQYPRLTATRVHEMLRLRGYTGSTGQVRRRIRQLELRPKPAREAFLRLHTMPGEQGQVDWGHFGKLRVGDAMRPLYGFVVVLAWSRAVHVYFSMQQTMAAVLQGHVSAFRAFGGIPRKLLYDNMKTVVIERVGDAIRFHPRLLELAGHYHFAPVVCPPRRPNEKGRVERRIRDLRSSFLAGRRFTDVADLQAQFVRWRDEVAYARPCPGKPEITVGEALDEERLVLLPQPEHDLETDHVRAVVARKQPYVTFDSNRYSIPYELIDTPITLAASDDRVRFLHGDEVVANHKRCWDRRKVVEDPAHIDGLVERKRRARTASGRTRLLDAVPEAEALYVELARRGEPMGSNTTALLRLLDRHGAEELRDAIAQAMERGTPRAASVEHVINLRLRSRGERPTLPVQLPERADVRNLRTRNHSLEEYDGLIRQQDDDQHDPQS